MLRGTYGCCSFFSAELKSRIVEPSFGTLENMCSLGVLGYDGGAAAYRGGTPDGVDGRSMLNHIKVV